MASTATVGTLNVEVALQLAKLQGDFDRMQGMVRNQTKASNRQFKEMGREGAAQLTGSMGVGANNKYPATTVNVSPAQ